MTSYIGGRVRPRVGSIPPERYCSRERIGSEAGHDEVCTAQCPNRLRNTLGAWRLVYEMLARRVPFQSQEKSMAELLSAHAHLRPPPVPNLTTDLQRIVDRALAKDLSARFYSAGGLAEALEVATT